MTKYVIDLPEGVKFIVGKRYVMLSEKELLRIPVENLQEYIAPTVAENAPVEKRVIELPSEVLKEVIRLKKDNTLLRFLKLVDNYAYGKLYEFANGSEFGDWYLGHTEFVPKKEPMFVVEVDRHEYIYASFIGSAIGKKTVDFWKIPQEVTEEEADELVAGLTALNARKVEVDE